MRRVYWLYFLTDVAATYFSEERGQDKRTNIPERDMDGVRDFTVSVS